MKRTEATHRSQRWLALALAGLSLGGLAGCGGQDPAADPSAGETAAKAEAEADAAKETETVTLALSSDSWSANRLISGDYFYGVVQVKYRKQPDGKKGLIGYSFYTYEPWRVKTMSLISYRCGDTYKDYTRKEFSFGAGVTRYTNDGNIGYYTPSSNLCVQIWMTGNWNGYGSASWAKL